MNKARRHIWLKYASNTCHGALSLQRTRALRTLTRTCLSACALRRPRRNFGIRIIHSGSTKDTRFTKINQSTVCKSQTRGKSAFTKKPCAAFNKTIEWSSGFDKSSLGSFQVENLQECYCGGDNGLYCSDTEFCMGDQNERVCQSLNQLIDKDVPVRVIEHGTCADMPGWEPVQDPLFCYAQRPIAFASTWIRDINVRRTGRIHGLSRRFTTGRRKIREAW